MKGDDDAVGGFFEDLPVLAFVLAGVALLLSTGIWVSERLDEAGTEMELDALAKDLMTCVLAQVRNPEAPELLPMLASVLGMNVSAGPSELDGYIVSVILRHPAVEWLKVMGAGSETPDRTGYASALLNALDERGLVVVLEVRVVAW